MSKFNKDMNRSMMRDLGQGKLRTGLTKGYIGTQGGAFANVVKTFHEAVQGDKKHQKKDAQEAQKQADADQLAQQQRDIVLQQRDQETQDYVDQQVDDEYNQVANLENEREQRVNYFSQNSSTRDGNAPYVPYDDGYLIMDVNGVPLQNQYQNPFWNMIDAQTQLIAQQTETEKFDDQDAQDQLTKDLPTQPTADQKAQEDAQQQTHTDINQVTSNQQIIQKQLTDTLTALGNNELTEEQALGQLNQINDDLDQILNSQVKTSSIYSSTIETF